MPTITLEEFRKWLQSLPPEEVVAQEWTSCDCPVAKWISTLPGVHHVSVCDAGWIFINHGHGRFGPDLWLRLFVRAIDRHYPNLYARYATAATCLKILGDVETNLKQTAGFFQ